MDWRYLIQIINQVEDKDLLNIENEKITFSKIPLIDIPIWYDKNEQIKDKLREEHPEAIDLWEDNEYLMGDLTPLWNDCNKKDIDFETLKERFLKIDKLCRMLNESQVKKEEYQFSNWYRLYRVISGLVQIGHIQRTKWEYEGCYFSYKEGTPWWL